VDHAHVAAPSDSNSDASPQPSTSHASDVDEPARCRSSRQRPLKFRPPQLRKRRHQTIWTVHERAGRIIADGKRLRVFTVDGTNEPRVVLLFPRESCSCPARTSCYHITAARLAVGLSDSGTRHPLNLTQLRRNKRRRADTTSGRKRPRAGDVDIVPAGDVDEDVATALTATITANQQQQQQPPSPTLADVEPSSPPAPSSPTPTFSKVTQVAGRRPRQRRRSLRYLWS